MAVISAFLIGVVVGVVLAVVGAGYAIWNHHPDFMED